MAKGSLGRGDEGRERKNGMGVRRRVKCKGGEGGRVLVLGKVIISGDSRVCLCCSSLSIIRLPGMCGCLECMLGGGRAAGRVRENERTKKRWIGRREGGKEERKEGKEKARTSADGEKGRREYRLRGNKEMTENEQAKKD